MAGRGARQSVPDHRTPLQLRRNPRQRRARETVGAIIQATEELVAVHGFDAVSTRLIAKRAGVGIGSLYQYFPTYESILFAWYERVSSEAAQQLRLTTLDVLDLPVADAVRIANTRLLDIYTRDYLALIEMPAQVAQIEQAIRHTSLEALNRATLRLFLGQHPEFDASYTDRHIFFIETISYQTMRRYVRNEPAFLPREDVIGELSAIILSYLARHTVPLPGSPSPLR